MGARISSLATAHGGLTPSPSGLVFFGYPLHPPGKPNQRRDEHLPAITIPMLFLHGERDPFGTPDEMRALVSGEVTRHSKATLELIDGGDHSLAAPKGKDPHKQSLERAMDLAAAWMRNLTH
jgi:predicted alpha/beta-hydrolase family hydrolase